MPIPDPTESCKRVLDILREDFVAHGHAPFKHFFCPILHEDIEAELCQGHIIPKDFGNAWVPQRSDVDRFYGSRAEAAFIACLQDRGIVTTALLLDKDKSKKHGPKIIVDGNVIEHYFPKDLSKIPADHAKARFVGGDGQILRDVAFKLTPEQLDAIEKLAGEGKELEVVIDRDYLPAFTAALIKAAHLTMFALFRYEWVFSVSGCDLAAILRKFYLENCDKPKAQVDGPLKEYFSKHLQMVKPFFAVDPSLLAGTINDRRIVAFVNGNNRPYLIGIMVKVGDDTFVVFAPASDDTIDTYFSFLKCPPASVAMHVLELKDGAWHGIAARRMEFEGNTLRSMASHGA